MLDEHLYEYISASDSQLDLFEFIPLGSLPENFGEVMKEIQDELKFSDFFAHFEDEFRNVLDEWDLDNAVTSPDSSPTVLPKSILPDIDIVCYGLGPFSSCYISRYQLGFLLILRRMLHSVHVYVYDPLFSDYEIDFLEELGLDVLDLNEEGRRELSRKTVCFMPRCPYSLYNNFLWANWNAESLSKIVIIGSSFRSLGRSRPKASLPFKYVDLVKTFVTEIRVRNVFRFRNIFDGLSVHYFKPSSLSLVASLQWTDLEEPPTERLYWARRYTM